MLGRHNLYAFLAALRDDASFIASVRPAQRHERRNGPWCGWRPGRGDKYRRAFTGNNSCSQRRKSRELVAEAMRTGQLMAAE